MSQRGSSLKIFDQKSNQMYNLRSVWKTDFKRLDLLRKKYYYFLFGTF